MEPFDSIVDCKYESYHAVCHVNDVFHVYRIRTVPDNKSRNISEVFLVRRGAVGVLGNWREGAGWVKGGANGVSLQTT
jgi:hypothetical protein